MTIPIMLLGMFTTWWSTGQEGQGVEGVAMRVHRAAGFDGHWVQRDDSARSANGDLALYGRSLELGISLEDGTWTTDGDEHVCRLALSSPGALAMEVLLEDVVVPRGATLRWLDMAGRERTPAAELTVNDVERSASTPMVFGDSAILEYRQPLSADIPGRFRATHVVHAYRGVEGWDAEREGPCHVSATCDPERQGWEDVIRSTVRISVVVPQGAGWCTGTLMNNVRADCKPYILTAFHCGWASTNTHFGQYKFYFNFQYATCSGGAYSTAQFLTGAQRRAYSADQSQQWGMSGSDFMLVELNTQVPEAFQPYWAGWDATNVSTSTADGVCIHHPSGSPKRISSYTQTITTGHPMGSSGLLSHWRVKWAATANGHGVTEQGSSGSGLFRQQGTSGPVLIGTLTGSSTGMTCTNNTGTSYFGKMNYHWSDNPNTMGQKLRTWLDPDGTGTTMLEGSAAPCAMGTGIIARPATPELLVFPNPATDRITLVDPVVDAQRWSIYDNAGRSVSSGRFSPTDRSIDVPGIAPGPYMLLVDRITAPQMRTRFIIAR